MQRAAMLKASGCLSSRSTDALEVLTNTVPFDLHLKLRQAQEVVKLSAKHVEDPLRQDFNRWVSGERLRSRKPTIFQLRRFNEMRGKAQFDKIEKEFKYDREFMGLMKAKGKVNTEDFKLDKNIQEANVRELLTRLDQDEIIVLTDGSALDNPGPTGGVVFLDGYQALPILLKKGVSPFGNHYTGELVVIQISLEFLAIVSQVKNRDIHILTDCQVAIITAFHSHRPTNKVEIIIAIKQHIQWSGVFSLTSH